MKRVVAIIVAVMLAFGCSVSACADTSRKEFFKEVNDFCLEMARNFIDTYNSGSKNDEIVMGAYHYYKMYKESSAINFIETWMNIGAGFADRSVIQVMNFGLMDSKIQESYKDWLDGKGESEDVIMNIDNAVKGYESVK